MQLNKDQIAVVIDVLRASTTIITAFANGCDRVIPMAEVKQAFKTAKKLINKGVLLGGERNEKIIPGFHLSNSPLEYTSAKVKNKTIVFTSTNGAQLFDFSQAAAQTVVCGFVNITSVCDYLLRANQNIAILCAGKNEQFGLEDVVCGGMLIKKILQKLNSPSPLNDGAVAAQILYQQFAGGILKMLHLSSHGKRLLQIGQDDDLKMCSAINSIDLVPIYKDGDIQLKMGFRND